MIANEHPDGVQVSAPIREQLEQQQNRLRNEKASVAELERVEVAATVTYGLMSPQFKEPVKRSTNDENQKPGSNEGESADGTAGRRLGKNPSPVSKISSLTDESLAPDVRRNSIRDSLFASRNEIGSPFNASWSNDSAVQFDDGDEEASTADDATVATRINPNRGMRADIPTRYASNERQIEFSKPSKSSESAESCKASVTKEASPVRPAIHVPRASNDFPSPGYAADLDESFDEEEDGKNKNLGNGVQSPAAHSSNSPVSWASLAPNMLLTPNSDAGGDESVSARFDREDLSSEESLGFLQSPTSPELERQPGTSNSVYSPQTVVTDHNADALASINRNQSDGGVEESKEEVLGESAMGRFYTESDASLITQRGAIESDAVDIDNANDKHKNGKSGYAFNKRMRESCREYDRLHSSCPAPPSDEMNNAAPLKLAGHQHLIDDGAFDDDVDDDAAATEWKEAIDANYRTPLPSKPTSTNHSSGSSRAHGFPAPTIEYDRMASPSMSEMSSSPADSTSGLRSSPSNPSMSSRPTDSLSNPFLWNTRDISGQGVPFLAGSSSVFSQEVMDDSVTRDDIKLANQLVSIPAAEYTNSVS